MRIGIDVKTLSKRYTGIAVYVHEMLRYFNEFNLEDEFFLYSHKDFELDFVLGKNFHKVIYEGITGSIGIMFQLSKQLEHDKIDLFWGTEHCLVRGKCKFKQVVTIHDLAALNHPEVGTYYNSILQRFMTISACKNADAIIAISKATADDVINTSGVDASKISIIYNGDSPYKGKDKEYTHAEIKRFYSKFNIYPLDYFLFVGSIEPRKNIPTLVKGYEEYRNCGGTQKLVLAGGLGWKFKPIIKAIKNCKYADDIIMTGYITSEEKEYLYRNSTSLVFPSLWEGFGLPALEAMSVGTPVILSKNSSLPEVGGDVALYIDDCMDYLSLSKLMGEITTMETADREKLEEECMQRAKLFSREKCAKQIIQLFHSL